MSKHTHTQDLKTLKDDGLKLPNQSHTPNHSLIITHLRLRIWNINFSIWIKLKRGMLSHLVDLSVLSYRPYLMLWPMWLIVIKRVWICGLKCKRPGYHHSASMTYVTDGIFKPTPVHASVICQIPRNCWIYTEFPFHLGKTQITCTFSCLNFTCGIQVCALKAFWNKLNSNWTFSSLVNLWGRGSGSWGRFPACWSPLCHDWKRYLSAASMADDKNIGGW